MKGERHQFVSDGQGLAYGYWFHVYLLLLSVLYSSVSEGAGCCFIVSSRSAI